LQKPNWPNELTTVRSAIMNHDTAALFGWLMAMLSYQGISDWVAHDYMEQHGRMTWREIERDEAIASFTVPAPQDERAWSDARPANPGEAPRTFDTTANIKVE
jgi:hypothetical protein